MKLFAIIFAIILLMNTANAKEFKITAAHTALTQEQEWLNVSRPLTAEDLKGRIILVDFWTFCCINCIHIMPDLKYLEQKFGDKLTVIGVHSAKFLNEKDSDNIRNAVLRYNLHHPVVNDKDFKIWKKMGVRAWPTLILINPQGMIASAYSGEGHRDDLDRDIAKLIDKNKGTMNETPLPIKLEAEKETPTYLKFPGKLAYAEDKNLLFVADSGHNRIVAMNPKGEAQYTIGGIEGSQDGSFKQAQFRSPQGMAYREGMLYVADTGNHSIRAIDLEKKKVTTIAGNGKQGFPRQLKNDDAQDVSLSSPWDVKFYPDTNHLAIAMAGTHQLWLYDIAKQTVSVLAGNGRESIDDGVYPDNSLSQPSGLAAVGDSLYFVDSETSSLRVIKDGRVRTLIGTGLFDFGFADGGQGKALLQHPIGITADKEAVYIADSYNHAIRKYDIATGQLTTLIGDGKRGVLNEPNDIIQIGSQFFIADTNGNGLKIWDGKNLETLEVKEASSVRKQPPLQLPNIVKTPAITAKAGVLNVDIHVPKGWKINHDAPSYLALFGKEETPLIVWPREELMKMQVLTPALTDGNYTLQGTMYYCEDKPNAPCLLQSVSQEIAVGKMGATSVKVDLK
jgi:thiol-disulfide isomerase/thioredoxin/sugar lactone lactonase YvrE